MTIPPVTRRETCRLCNSADLVELFSLGEQYVSDFVDQEHIYSGVKCPLELILCKNCTLVQLRHTAPQEILYTGNYWYKSGVTETMRAALRDIVEAAAKRVNIKPEDAVLDIGSNDGTLLRHWKDVAPEVITIGIEPAKNFVEEGKRGVDLFINDFWPDTGQGHLHYNDHSLGDKLAKTLPEGEQGFFRAKVVTAIGMFYDLEDPNPFVRDVARVLAPDGIFVAQLMCAKQTVENNDAGNYAHEHLEFYTLRSLEKLFVSHDLMIFDIEKNNVNGGSYRLWVKHRDGSGRSTTVIRAMAEERELSSPATWHSHFGRMVANRDKVAEFVFQETAAEKRVWVYGASTKGNVLLQWYSLDYSLISGAADRSPSKWGKYTIGTGIKIYSEEEARKAKPDYFLVLPYAFIDEFVEREKDWLNGGGTFIVPLPVPRLIRRAGLAGTEEVNP